MRMRASYVDLQPPSQPGMQPILGQHAQNGFPNQTLRFLLKKLSGGNLFQPARISRSVPVDLVVQLLAGKANLLGIDDYQP